MQQTILEILEENYKKNPDKILYRYIDNNLTELTVLSFSDVRNKAKRLACFLAKTYKPNTKVLMLYPSGLEFNIAFLACLYAKLIAVPAYPPRRNQKINRLKSIIDNSKASLVLCTLSTQKIIEGTFKEDSILKRMDLIVSDDLKLDLDLDTKTNILPKIKTQDLAFLQYTSGSTGNPKGVMISHANILDNAKLIYYFCEHSEKSTILSWLPHFHDMGLIGGVIQPIYGNFTSVFLAPVSFLQKPSVWLRAIDKYKANSSGGPNSAYDLCVQNIADEEIKGLDLSSWKVAINGAEPVNYNTINAFNKKFAKYGFKSSTFYPCYGMAESTLIITGVEAKEEIKTFRLKQDDLKDNKITKSIEEKGSKTLVSSGKAYPNQKLFIVDMETKSKLKEREVGEVWVQNPSVAKGYFQDEEKTKEDFCAFIKDTNEGPFLRTGDLGFLDNNELYICGRAKDLLIIRGRNYYPQDIEQIASLSHEGFAVNSCAAFSIDVGVSEKLVIVQEIKRTYLRKIDFELAKKILKESISQEFELQVYDIVFLKPGQILKTSSGKIQRRTNKKAYEDNLFKSLPNKDSQQKKIKEVVETKKDIETINNLSLLEYKNMSKDKRYKYIENALKIKISSLTDIKSELIESKQSLLSLGLDSLSLTQLLSFINITFFIAISLDELFELDDLSNLLELIDTRMCKGIAFNNSKIPKATNKFILSYPQERLWFLDELMGKSPTYNIPGLLKLSGTLNKDALKHALREILIRHEVLRVNFIKVNDKVRTKVNSIDSFINKNI